MDHSILESVLVWVVIAIGLLSLLRFLLTDVGEFWRWFKNWWRML